MREFVEAWKFLRLAQAVEEPALRKRLIASHYRIVLFRWHGVRFDRPRPDLGELLLASGAVS